MAEFGHVAAHRVVDCARAFGGGKFIFVGDKEEIFVGWDLQEFWRENRSMKKSSGLSYIFFLVRCVNCNYM